MKRCYIFVGKNQKNNISAFGIDNASNEGISNQVIGLAKQNGNKIDFVFKFKDDTHFYTTFSFDLLKDT